MINIRECMSEHFYSKLSTIIQNKNHNSSFLTKEKYSELVKRVSDCKMKIPGRKPDDYQRLKRYDVIRVGEVDKLIFPVSKECPGVKFYVHIDELFSVIHETHIAIGHGGRNRMLDELKKTYKNITAEEVMIYLNLCENCPKNSKTSKKGLVVDPMSFQEINSRCQVDLINMQRQPDNEFKFILVYQDQLTKFVQLRALKGESAEEVACVLIDIFTIFGAPSVLQSDSGRKFSNQIVEHACSVWPDLRIVHGKPRQSQTQGCIGRLNQDIENMLHFWLESNKTSKWSEGLRFIQLTKNRAYHAEIKCSPYEAMFGSPVKVGLRSSSLPNDILENVRTEEDLVGLIEKVKRKDASETASDTVVDGTNSDTNSTGPVKYQHQNTAVLPHVNVGNGKVKEDNHRSVSSSTTPGVTMRQRTVRKKRRSAKDGLETPAKKVQRISNRESSPTNEGERVKLDVPEINSVITDPRHLLEVILEVQND